MGMSSRAGNPVLGPERVTVRVPSPAEMAVTSARRAPYRWEAWARHRAAAASAAVRGDPSEKVTPDRSVNV